MPTLEHRNNYTITFSDIDPRGITRPSSMANIMQDLATLHAINLGISREDLNVIWVLTRIKMDIFRPIETGETLTGTTWCSEIKGPSWLRGFIINDKDGKEIAKASTSWVMLQHDTNTILRPSIVPNYKDLLNHDRPSYPMPPKIALGDMTICRNHLVSYSDLDINNHLNNAKIIDIVSDALEINLYNRKFVDKMQVNFIAQCTYGENIILKNQKLENDNVLICGTVDNLTKFEASAHFARY